MLVQRQFVLFGPVMYVKDATYPEDTCLQL